MRHLADESELDRAQDCLFETGADHRVAESQWCQGYDKAATFLDILAQSPYPQLRMIYVRIPEKHDAKGFLLLAKSGSPVICLPDNTYGAVPEHIKILKRNRIPFKKLTTKNVRLPKPSLAA